MLDERTAFKPQIEEGQQMQIATALEIAITSRKFVFYDNFVSF